MQLGSVDPKKPRKVSHVLSTMLLLRNLRSMQFISFWLLLSLSWNIFKYTNVREKNIWRKIKSSQLMHWYVLNLENCTKQKWFGCVHQFTTELLLLLLLPLLLLKLQLLNQITIKFYFFTFSLFIHLFSTLILHIYSTLSIPNTHRHDKCHHNLA